MSDKFLQLSENPHEQVGQLKIELERARRELNSADAALAEEQAAVNRFRMHCRLKIGSWVEQVLTLRSEKQSLLIKLQLIRQAQDMGLPFDDDDPFGELDDFDDDPDLILPTDLPQDKAAEKRLYRQLIKRFHPDLAAVGAERAYATTMMTAVNVAYEQGDIDALRNMAGEMDPELVAQLSGGPTAEIRRLRQLLLGCKRRRNKVQQQVKALRSENTARLWRKANRLEEAGLNWWDEVRVELVREIDKLKVEIGNLDAMLVDK